MGVFEDVMTKLDLLPREQQVRLVDLARSAVKDERTQFVQAGTGTGKSFAVLSTALESSANSGKSSVVVCPNNSLIDQYVHKDAPAVQGAAGGRFVHIKGRSRYVCASSRALRTAGNAKYRYRELVDSGELEWAKLGLTEDHGCPGSDDCDPRGNCSCGAIAHNKEVQAAGRSRDMKPCICPPSCGAVEAKNRAQGADVIITNAHVLVWDYLIGQYTDGAVRLLPEYGALFVDECHELESVGRGCMLEEISQGNPICALVEGLSDWIEDRTETMMELGLTETLLDRSLQVQAMAEQADVMATRIENQFEQSRSDRKRIKQLRRFVDFVSESEDFVSLIDTSNPEKTVLRRVCVNGSMMFSQLLTGQPSVLVSGTIPSSDRRRLGVSKAPIADVGHPFDYSKSQLVTSVYDPKEAKHTHHRIASAVRAINQTKGGTLVLFTSWQDIEQVAPRIAYGLDPGIDVYVQSREDPATLQQDILDFKADGNAVLMGVRSLFTGLDIPGPALRQVIMWKLPYQVPTIEVNAIADRFGRGTYRDQMLMVLVQGVGRLIRTTEDRGRVLILDSRAIKLDWSSNGMTHHLAEFSKR